MGTTDTILDERTTEAALVAGAEQGHRAAFDELYRRHADHAWRLALAITRDPAAAAGVVPDSFAKVFTAIRAGRCTTDAPFRPQLLTAARNAALDRQRDDDRDLAADGRSIDANEPIDAAFGCLPERWRSTLWLGEVEAMTNADIGSIVGLSTDATAQLADRAGSGLREQLLRIHVAASSDHDCSRTLKRVGAYVTGSLPTGDRGKIEQHLAGCADCAAHHAETADVSGRLHTLALPLPTLLVDDTRTAWTAAVATNKGTGLSETTEKVLAGVSAAAAVIGVIGATIFGVDRGSTDDQHAASRPIAPIVTEASGPQPDLGAGIDLITEASGIRRSTGSGPVGGAISTVSLPRDSTDGSASDAGSSADSPTSDPAPVTAEGPGSDPSSSAPVPPLAPPSADESPVVGDGSGVTVGTTIADVPIAVEVSDDPGVTVGPIELGSAPEPGDEPIEMAESDSDSGSTEPTDSTTTTVETIDDVVDGTTGLLG